MYTLYMALHINNPETERNVRALAAATGESIADAINKAVTARLLVVRTPVEDPTLKEDVMEIVRRINARPRLDDTNPEAFLYDEDGLPH